ncbi:MAG: ABC transporter ATP-binding protein [Actinobacteria bacterium]|nr:ABC transporter ATP-binding protein [Actinomycetota bacterium]
MIELRGVTKRYGGNTAVDKLTLHVKSGELAVILGPSGCGKTTTLRAINRMIEIDEGEVLIDGMDVRHRNADELRRHIGYGIQSVGLFPHMTVARNIATVPLLLGWSPKRVSARVAELLELVGLEPAAFERKRPHELSGGQAQRVGVARALAADPPVLLMDEPFGALDPLMRARLQQEFRRLQEILGKTVVFVTHDVEEALVLADRIALMRDGRLVQYDTPEALWQRPADEFVSRFFGEEFSLKVLSRFSITDVAVEPGAADGLPVVTADMTPKEVISVMLGSGQDRVAVRDAAGAHAGVLTFSALVASIRGRDE